MTLLQQIRAEIERRKNALPDDWIGAPAVYEEYESLLSFLDTLQEQEPKGLDDAAEEYAYNECPSQGVANIECEKHFKAGAKWMAEQGISCEGEIVKDISNKLAVTAKLPELERIGKFGDKVIVQIRKKQ